MPHLGNEVPDTDSDGIPDWWEQKYFAGVTACDAGALSGNGELTFKETYIAAVDLFAYDPLLITLENGKAIWMPKASRLYDVEWTSDLYSNFIAIASDLAWPADRYLDAAHTNESSGFYRMKIHL